VEKSLSVLTFGSGVKVLSGVSCFNGVAGIAYDKACMCCDNRFSGPVRIRKFLLSYVFVLAQCMRASVHFYCDIWLRVAGSAEHLISQMLDLDQCVLFNGDLHLGFSRCVVCVIVSYINAQGGH